MVYIHSFKNPGDGNFYLATESGVPKLHSYESFSYINVTIYQSGPDVIATLSGSFNTPSEQNITTNGGFSTYLYPGGATVAFSNITGSHPAKKYLWSSPLGDWGVNASKYPTSKSVEQTVGIDTTGIAFPDAYVRGTYFTNTMTFANTTLVELGYDRFETITRTLGRDSSVILTYTVVTPPTPTPTPTVSFSATPTPTSTPTPTPTSSPVSLTPTPTPSRSYENPSIYGVIGTTNAYFGLTGTGDSAGFDGGGYTYDWAQIPNKIDGGGYTYLTYDGLVFVIGSVLTRGTTMGALPNFFKPYISGYPGAKVVSPFPQKRRVWLLGAGVEGGGDVYYYYTYRNTTTGAISTSSSYNLHMDDWCAGSTSQTVHASMSQRLHASGGPHVITTRIYRYTLEAIPTGNEIISINFDNNVNGFNCRVVGMGWAQN